MATDTTLNRFVEAQSQDYATALAEIRNGRKQSHWIWYIFPQLQGLGHSHMAQYYGIRDAQEARDYLQHPELSRRLVEISKALLNLQGKTATQVLGTPDDLKVRSSMTLFSAVAGADPVFQAVLDKYYNGVPDPETLRRI